MEMPQVSADHTMAHSEAATNQQHPKPKLNSFGRYVEHREASRTRGPSPLRYEYIPEDEERAKEEAAAAILLSIRRRSMLWGFENDDSDDEIMLDDEIESAWQREVQMFQREGNVSPEGQRSQLPIKDINIFEFLVDEEIYRYEGRPDEHEQQHGEDVQEENGQDVTQTGSSGYQSEVAGQSQGQHEHKWTASRVIGGCSKDDWKTIVCQQTH